MPVFKSPWYFGANFIRCVFVSNTNCELGSSDNTLKAFEKCSTIAIAIQSVLKCYIMAIDDNVLKKLSMQTCFHGGRHI